ncbi:DUF4157 domain-containing protein [Nitrosomonas sp. Nm166]|uniref:eCIS core domain-containing protein n=1 Tax=Nitrosomonas sp. Nm166 TaxID=1881054 RepID=UPI0008DFC9DD|nr:DUF4157 domain-containing protein [Nitrosomonas sp. Nm166]SFE85711.1 Novel toxin 16 [Nitrosomonas sp. Nm166]
MNERAQNQLKQSSPTFFTPVSSSALQRKCACGNHTTAGGECPECSKKKMGIQRKLAISASNDPLEQEADRVADQVMAAPANAAVSNTPLRIQRYMGQGPGDTGIAPPSVDRVLASSGRPLEPALRQDMEQRFGHDFSQVRVHTGSAAELSARDVNSHAYTVGNHVVFGAGQFAPNSSAGKRLIAHELTHVVQQRATSDIHHFSMNRNGEPRVQSSELHMGMDNHLVQRVMCEPPQPKIPLPGDCSWAKYIVLRGSVETAKAVVNTLGACSAGDSCLFLATKIAAVTAEIAARVAIMETCFRGGDDGHCTQLKNKINMMNRCYHFFSNSNCPPELIEAMAAVVESARAIIAAAAVGVAIALVVALIAAIIALAKVIAALAAAAAEAAAAAAVIALLVLIKEELSPEGSTGA